MEIAQLLDGLRRDQRSIAGQNDDQFVGSQRFTGDHQGVSGSALFFLQHKLDAGMRHRFADTIGFVPDDGVDVLRGNNLVAAAITCASNGLPPTSCSTLGCLDFSRVPLPAAMIAMAMRGAACDVWLSGVSAFDPIYREGVYRAGWIDGPCGDVTLTGSELAAPDFSDWFRLATSKCHAGRCATLIGGVAGDSSLLPGNHPAPGRRPSFSIASRSATIWLAPSRAYLAFISPETGVAIDQSVIEDACAPSVAVQGANVIGGGQVPGFRWPASSGCRRKPSPQRN